MFEKCTLLCQVMPWDLTVYIPTQPLCFMISMNHCVKMYCMYSFIYLFISLFLFQALSDAEKNISVFLMLLIIGFKILIIMNIATYKARILVLRQFVGLIQIYFLNHKEH